MSQQLIPSSGNGKVQCITLFGHSYRRSRFFAAFLICAALLVAAFAVSGVWSGGFGEKLHLLGSFWEGETTGEPTDLDQAPGEDAPVTAPAEDPTPTPERIPEGATAIRAEDLACMSLGSAYLHNETAYSPDIAELLLRDVSAGVGREPLVLILHTHATESYLPSGTSYVEGAIGDMTYTSNGEENMLSLGAALGDLLNQKGIPAIHCTVMHDGTGFGNAYARALESIEFYLAHYPSIRYVIDLHRDAVMTANGECIKSLAGGEGGDTAQVMAVVGSDAGGETNERWEGNLALALQLREALNAALPGVARPVTLRNETYNQELAPYSLLLEIGTAANTKEEAMRALILVADALERLIRAQ